MTVTWAREIFNSRKQCSDIQICRRAGDDDDNYFGDDFNLRFHLKSLQLFIYFVKIKILKIIIIKIPIIKSSRELVHLLLKVNMYLRLSCKPPRTFPMTVIKIRTSRGCSTLQMCSEKTDLIKSAKTLKRNKLGKVFLLLWMWLNLYKDRTSNTSEI